MFIFILIAMTQYLFYAHFDRMKKKCTMGKNLVQNYIFKTVTTCISKKLSKYKSIDYHFIRNWLP